MLSLALALLTGAAPDGGVQRCGGVPCARFRDARAAFREVLVRRPAVLAVGEVHERTGAPKVPSALKRFTQSLLPALQGQAGALVAETWMLSGRCGVAEKSAAQQVEKVTERPDSTEDELTALLDRSYALGLKNHLLRLSCDDYRSMLDADGELDPEKSLALVKRKVEEKALEVMEKGEAGQPGKALVLYGGALHNDVEPLPGMGAYSFAWALQRETDGGYVELDLLVPEYLEGDEDYTGSAWLAPALALGAGGSVVLLSPRPDVFFLLFPRTPARPQKRSKPDGG